MKLLLCLIAAFLTLNVSAGKKINLAEKVDAVDRLIQVSGKATGFDRSIQRRADGWIDFAITMPSLSKANLIDFHINNIISLKSDYVDLFGYDFEIPSNFSLPKQKESYIISININKPNLRTLFPKDGTYPVSTIHGKFKVGKVVEKVILGRPIFSLINDFKFVGGGQTNINTVSQNSGVKFKADKFSYDGKATIVAPKYNKKAFTLFSVPMAETNGFYRPTDLKFINSGKKVKVSTSTNNKMHSLNIITDDIKKYEDPFFNGGINEDGEPVSQEYVYSAEFNRSTLSFLPLNTGDKFTPFFLDMVEPPEVNGTTLILYPPELINEATPLATVVELVSSQKFKNGKLVGDYRKTIWKSTKPGWIKSITMPSTNLPSKKGVTYIYEVSFLATTDKAYNPFVGQLDLGKFSLMTKNYLVIK